MRWHRIAGGGALMRPVPSPRERATAWIQRVDRHLQRLAPYGFDADALAPNAEALARDWQAGVSPSKAARKALAGRYQ